MATNQPLLHRLQSYEQELTRYRELFGADGGEVDQQALQQLDTLDRMIKQIRSRATQQQPSGTGEPSSDLSGEHEAAKIYARAWQQALNEVSSQVGKIRSAMAPMRDKPTVAAIYDGLAAYDGMDNVEREFPDLDLSKLVDAAKNNDLGLYDATLKQTAKEVGQARRELTELRPLLNALDDNPYGVKTNADDVVTRVLEEIASGLGVQ